ncbi:MAG: sporulation transcriptional regulator SpoIIID [Acetatifactor sp.]|nr:sporulation transcriptional regulator SpoIIID [Acetatifactor sp.]
MKDYIEKRAISIANYIIGSNATVRQTAKAFGVNQRLERLCTMQGFS